MFLIECIYEYYRLTAVIIHCLLLTKILLFMDSDMGKQITMYIYDTMMSMTENTLFREISYSAS